MLLAYNGKISMGDDFQPEIPTLFCTDPAASRSATRCASPPMSSSSPPITSSLTQTGRYTARALRNSALPSRTMCGLGLVRLSSTAPTYRVAAWPIARTSAVVRSRTTPMAVYAGAPARLIKRRLPSGDTNQAPPRSSRRHRLEQTSKVVPYPGRLMWPRASEAHLNTAMISPCS